MGTATTSKHNTHNDDNRTDYGQCFTKTAGKTLKNLRSDQFMHKLSAPKQWKASNHNVSRKRPHHAISTLKSKTDDSAPVNVLWAPRMEKRTRSRIRVDLEGKKEILIEAETMKGKDIETEEVLPTEVIVPMDMMAIQVDSDGDLDIVPQSDNDDGDDKDSENKEDKDEEDDDGIFMALVFDDDEENESEDEYKEFTESIAKVLTFDE